VTVHVVKVGEDFALPRRTRDRQQARLNATLEAMQAKIRAALARDPERYLMVGDRTVNAGGAVVSSPVVWPDGVVGAYSATVADATSGRVNSYLVTWPGPTGTLFYRQPPVTRNAAGQVVGRPALVIGTSDTGVTSGYGADAYGSDPYGG